MQQQQEQQQQQHSTAPVASALHTMKAAVLDKGTDLTA
jgi:hypothetical protein